MKNTFQMIGCAMTILLITSCGGSSEGDVASDTSDGIEPTTVSTPLSNPTSIPPSTPVEAELVGNVAKTNSGSLPAGFRNAAERKAFPHYIGSLKDLTGRHPKQLPIRTYFAACQTDTDSPRMFVSMTLEDPNSDLDIPTIGSVFETRYDPTTKSLYRTGQETTIPVCQETHGIAVSSDCSRVAVLCNPEFETPASETESVTKDLVIESGKSSINQPNNEAAVNARLSDPEKRLNAYKYNGEMWLLEWNGTALTEDPDRYVIHKAVGGQQLGATTLVYSEEQDVYAAAFTTNSFDNNGGRHKSGALMVIDRDGWKLNPDDPRNNDRERGWTWGCANGHVLHMRAFYNPFVGHFGALCTSDGSKYWYGQTQGAIAAKMETSSTTFEGYESFVVASHNSAITNGGGHKFIAVDETQALIAVVGTDVVPTDDPDYMTFIDEAEQAAITNGRSERGIKACEWWWGEHCLKIFLEEYYYDKDSRYPTFRWGFWNGVATTRDLTKIGIVKVGANGRNEIDGVSQYVQWIVEDNDCMLGAPQLTEIGDNRYLLGWAKFQCLSDDLPLARFAGAHTLHPKTYYLMEIDADGNRLTEPMQVEATGWGGMDEMVSLGNGRVGWAYISNPEISSGGSYTDPYQSNWELMVYESPLE